MTKLTPAQKTLLTRARDFGNPWMIGERNSQPWRSSTSRSIDTLVSKGLLAYPAGRGHCAPAITDAGREALK